MRAATATKPVSPSRRLDPATTANPTAKAVAPATTSPTTRHDPRTAELWPPASVSFLMINCSTGIRKTVIPKNSKVHITATGAKASLPRARPPTTWNTIDPTAAARVPNSIIDVPEIRRDGRAAFDAGTCGPGSITGKDDTAVSPRQRRGRVQVHRQWLKPLKPWRTSN